MTEDSFINLFNENYPFERYILKTPVRINALFDDLLLTEIFVPETEIRPIIDENKHLVKYTEVPRNEIYVKVKSKHHHQSMRLAFYDFSEEIREEIEYAMIKDFGQYEWECLYIDFDAPLNDLQKALQTQYSLIKAKYGNCDIKNITCVNTLEICEKLK